MMYPTGAKALFLYDAGGSLEVHSSPRLISNIGTEYMPRIKASTCLCDVSRKGGENIGEWLGALLVQVSLTIPCVSTMYEV
jgi:hypothetical protein